MEKILSVIVPTYNMEKYLERCLSSLVLEPEQMQKLEVLVVNDGSKDRSSEIAHHFSDEYPNTFIVIDKENGHYGSCVNNGLGHATGKYVKLLDSDDFYDTDNLSAFIEVLENNDVDMFLSDEKTILDDGRQFGYYDYHMSPDSVHDVSDLPVYIEESIPHQCITWRTEIFKSIGYRQTEGIMYTDLEWVFTPLSRVGNFYYFPRPVYMYRRGLEEQSVAPIVHSANMWMENMVIMNILHYFQSIEQDLPESNKQIMSFILKRNIQRIYSHYLINFPKYTNKDDLKAFDSSLFEVSPSIYNSVNNAIATRKFLTFNYIAEWRKKKSRCTVKYIYFDIMNGLGQLSWGVRQSLRKVSDR